MTNHAGRGMKMKVEFSCGMRVETVEFPDTYTEDDVQCEFDIWLENRSDIGWNVVEGKLADIA
jgi:hypothetical protein